jgi:hypothetical protein
LVVAAPMSTRVGYKYLGTTNALAYFEKIEIRQKKKFFSFERMSS